MRMINSIMGVVCVIVSATSIIGDEYNEDPIRLVYSPETYDLDVPAASEEVVKAMYADGHTFDTTQSLSCWVHKSEVHSPDPATKIIGRENVKLPAGREVVFHTLTAEKHLDRDGVYRRHAKWNPFELQALFHARQGRLYLNILYRPEQGKAGEPATLFDCEVNVDNLTPETKKFINGQVGEPFKVNKLRWYVLRAEGGVLMLNPEAPRDPRRKPEDVLEDPWAEIQDPKEWTLTSGETFTGTFIGYNSGRAAIDTDEGRRVIRATEFCESDRDYIRKASRRKGK